MTNSQEQCKKLLTLLKEKTALENHLKDLNKRIFRQQQDTYDMMFEEEVNSIEVEGITFKPIEDYNFKQEIPKGMKLLDFKPFREWLALNKYEGLIKTREDIHHQTLKSTFKEHYESGRDMPDCIATELVPMVKYSKAAVERLVNEKPDY